MVIKICVPRSWKRRVKSSMLHAISLARYCLASIQGKAATSRSPRVRHEGRIDQFEQDNSLLQEELRIKDARMLNLSPHRRPYYASIERMAILELRATVARPSTAALWPSNTWSAPSSPRTGCSARPCAITPISSTPPLCASSSPSSTNKVFPVPYSLFPTPFPAPS